MLLLILFFFFSIFVLLQQVAKSHGSVIPQSASLLSLRQASLPRVQSDVEI